MGDNIVKLNIGGVKYYTTRTTLLANNSDDNSANNFFRGLLSGVYNSVKDEKGFYFIDRNGKLFEPILDYLRTGKWRCPKEKEEVVLEEARFYGIEPNVYQALTNKSLYELVQQFKMKKANESFETHKEWLTKIAKEISEKFEECANNGSSIEAVILPSIEMIKQYHDDQYPQHRGPASIIHPHIYIHDDNLWNILDNNQAYQTILTEYLRNQCELSVVLVPIDKILWDTRVVRICRSYCICWNNVATKD